MCSMLYSQKPGGTRKQPVLRKGFSGDQWLDKTIHTKPAVPCRARVLPAHCRATNLRLTLLLPAAAVVHTSHILHISCFQINRAGQFGPGAFITNLFSFPQSPATKKTRHTDSGRKCSIHLIFYCTPE